MEIKLKLNYPEMTDLHKAGLAGLYMTLQAFEKKNIEIEGLSWHLEPNQITLTWLTEKPKSTFDKLIKKSFWIDQEGFLRLTGLEQDSSPNLEQKHLLQTAILDSFLQFGNHRKIGSEKTLTYEVDDKSNYIKFAPLITFRHQKASEDFFDKKGNFLNSIEAKGWFYPGGSQKHEAHKNTILSEPLHIAIPLLFAPVGVIYFKISSRLTERKTKVALLIPDIKDLNSYSELRQEVAAFGALKLTASSSADAVLKLLVKSKKVTEELENSKFICRVLTFGTVGWNPWQKTRTYSFTLFSQKIKGLKNYLNAEAIFPNKWQQEKNTKSTAPQVTKKMFLLTSPSREIISENIARNLYWYCNLAHFIANKETRKNLYYEQKEMSEMVEKADFEHEREKLFIEVFHESWKRRLGKLGERVKKENADFNSIVQKEAEKIRVTISRAKNADSLRETVVDFWARSGSLSQLQNGGLIKILPLFDEENWKRTKDLSLLALISYRLQSQENNINDSD